MHTCDTQLPQKIVASNIISTWQNETVYANGFIIINFCWR